MSYWSNLFSDPSFMGALIGAGISGGIAIFIMNRNNVVNKKEEEKRKIIDFLKESDYLLYSVKDLINQINIYVEYQYEDESIKNRRDEAGFSNKEVIDINFAKSINEVDIKESIDKIKKVDRKAFTRDTLSIYLDILSVAEGHIEYFWKRSLERDVGGIASILEESAKKLNELKNKLEEAYKEKEKEIS